MLGLAEQVVGCLWEAVLEVGCWSRINECVNLPMDSLERTGQSTFEKAAYSRSRG